MIRYSLLLLMCICAVACFGGDPMATTYTMRQCEGSLTPYPTPTTEPSYPDSLVPVFINHVSRHGSRYPTSAANNIKLEKALNRADSLGTITPLGRSFAKLNARVVELSTNRWGALDSLGQAEQSGIATRMFFNYTEVFSNGGLVQALSSYSPRAMMSMYSFVHQLDRLNNRLTFTTSTGRINSPLMRPFDLNADYLAFRKEKPWQKPYDQFVDAHCPRTAICRILGSTFPFANENEAQELALAEFRIVAGLPAMGEPSQMTTYFSQAEANDLWSCFNLQKYFQRTATTISTVPADIASDLVLNIVNTTDAFITGSDAATCAVLRFGHAETMMPLLSLLRIPGCYYLTNYYDTVATHWRDFDIVPMASNIQFILFKARKSGLYYMQVLLNERPIKLRPGDDTTIYPWGEVRRYMNRCVPQNLEL